MCGRGQWDQQSREELQSQVMNLLFFVFHPVCRTTTQPQPGRGVAHAIRPSYHKHNTIHLGYTMSQKSSITWCFTPLLSVVLFFFCWEKWNFCKDPGRLPHFCQGTTSCRFLHGCFITSVVVVCQPTSVAWHNLCQVPFASFISGLFPVIGLSMSVGGWLILRKIVLLLWRSKLLYQCTITWCHTSHLWQWSGGTGYWLIRVGLRLVSLNTRPPCPAFNQA